MIHRHIARPATALTRPARLLASTFPSCPSQLVRATMSRPYSQTGYGVPASFYRGGTSKALIFAEQDLPASQRDRDALYLSAMGSPDPNGRQLDGMGGGYSSVSKVVVVGKSRHEGADVDYTFCQVLVDKPVVDYAGNCGNMLAAVGPFALEKGLVPPNPTDKGNLVRIHNTNTGKLIHALFPANGTTPLLSGNYAIDGVSGTHARISLEFLNPQGSRTGKLLPTGQVVDTLDLGSHGTVSASLLDCGNPCAFVLASDVGLSGTELPSQIHGDVLAKLNALRNAAAVKMGLARTLDEAERKRSVPKVVVLSAPVEHEVLSGATLREDEVDIVGRCISSGDPHRALPITAALCTAAAAQVPGTLVEQLARMGNGKDGIVIGHASGTIAVDAEVQERDGEWEVPMASVFRTARKLFEGRVFVDAGEA